MVRCGEVWVLGDGAEVWRRRGGAMAGASCLMNFQSPTIIASSNGISVRRWSFVSPVSIGHMLIESTGGTEEKPTDLWSVMLPMPAR